MDAAPEYSVCPFELAMVLSKLGIKIGCARYWHEDRHLRWHLLRQRKSEKDHPAPTAEELSEIIPDYIEIDFPEGPLRGFLMIQRIVRGKAPPQEQTPSGKGRVPILIAEQKEGRNWEVGYLEGRYENGLPIITNPDQMLIAIPADVLASAFVKLLMVLFIQMAVEGITWRSLDPLTGEEIPKPSLNPPPPPPDPE